jgi:hypothetical protein
MVAGTELFASYTDDGERKTVLSELGEDDKEVMLDNAVTMSQAVREQDAERNAESDYEP